MLLQLSAQELFVAKQQAGVVLDIHLSPVLQHAIVCKLHFCCMHCIASTRQTRSHCSDSEMLGAASTTFYGISSAEYSDFDRS